MIYQDSSTVIVPLLFGVSSLEEAMEKYMERSREVWEVVELSG